MANLRLRSMTPEEFRVYRERAVREYAQEHVRSGDWEADGAEQRAAEQTDKLLPDGPGTEAMLLMVAEAPEDGIVGLAWLGTRHPDTGEPGSGWLYDIEIDADQRGKGYGRALLSAVEDLAAEHACAKLGLNVFGHNSVARGLYDSAGYGVTGVHMIKALGGDSV